MSAPLTYEQAYAALRCSCCDAVEPAGGWPSIGSAGSPESLEAYCSDNCFRAHMDGSCPCFAEDEVEQGLDGDEDWL